MTAYSATDYHNGTTPPLDSTNWGRLETGIQTGHSELDALMSSAVGIILAMPTTTAPAGWVKCDNTAISRTGANAALFALIGTAYGIGDGSTTFNVPDLRGLFVRGLDVRTSGNRDTWPSEHSGAARTVGTYQADRNKQHEHALNYHATDATQSTNTRAGGWIGNSVGDAVVHTTWSVQSTGTEFAPKNLAVCYYIKL